MTGSHDPVPRAEPGKYIVLPYEGRDYKVLVGFDWKPIEAACRSAGKRKQVNLLKEMLTRAVSMKDLSPFSRVQIKDMAYHYHVLDNRLHNPPRDPRDPVRLNTCPP